MSETRGCEDRGDEQRCFVADTASGVLIDDEGVECLGVSDLSGETHSLSERGEFSRVEAPEKDRHQKGADLGDSIKGKFNDMVDGVKENFGRAKGEAKSAM